MRKPLLFCLWLFVILLNGLFMRTYYRDSESFAMVVSMLIALSWPASLFFFYKPFKESLLLMLRDRHTVSFIGLYFIINVFSLLNSLDPLISMGYLATTVLCLVLAYSFHVSLSVEEKVKGLALYGLAGTAALAVYLYFADFTPQGRLGGTLNPNAIGMIALSVIAASFLSRKKWYAVIVSVPALVVLYLTNSRASMAALIIIAALLSAFKLRMLRGFGSAAFVCFSTALLLSLLSYFAESIQELIASVFVLDDPYRGIRTGVSGRMVAWKDAWDIFLANPLIGVGYRMHEHYMRLHSSAHNGYLAMLAETGILGFSIVVYFILTALVTYWRSIRNPFSLWSLSVIVAYLFIAFFERYLFNVGNPLSVIITVLLIQGFSQRSTQVKTIATQRCDTPTCQ